MDRIRKLIVVAGTATALALPAGCGDEADKAAKDVEREAEKAVKEAKEAERDIQKKDLP